MSMVLGQCTVLPVTGAVGRAWTRFVANPDSGVSAGALVVGSTQQKMIAALLDACVGGLFDEIQASAVATIMVSAGGLQKSTAAGNPTDPPASPQTLTGSVG